MKCLSGSFTVVLWFLFSTPVFPAHNLTFNGQSVYTVQSPDDTVALKFDLEAPGAAFTMKIWIDVDRNGVLDTSRDVFFGSDPNGGRDGDFEDDDHLVNGSYLMVDAMGNDFFPISFIIIVSDNGVSDTGALIVPTIPSNNSLTLTLSQPIPNILMGLSHLDPYGNLTQAWGMSDSTGKVVVYIPDSLAGETWTFQGEFIIFSAIFTAGRVGNFYFAVPDTSFAVTGHLQGPVIPVIPATAWVRGQVKDPAGNTVTSHPSISSVGVQEAATGAFAGWARVVNGAYELPLGAGDWSLFFLSIPGEDSNYLVPNESNRGMITLLDGDTLSGVDFTVYPKNAAITGKVTLSGAPVAGIEVSANYYTNTLDVSTSARTDSNGYYTLRVSSDLNDPSGYRVELSGLPDSLAALPEWYDSVAASADSLDFLLHRKGGLITGFVYREGTTIPVGNAYVTISLKDYSASFGWANYVGSAYTASDGSFRFWVDFPGADSLFLIRLNATRGYIEGTVVQIDSIRVDGLKPVSAGHILYLIPAPGRVSGVLYRPAAVLQGDIYVNAWAVNAAGDSIDISMGGIYSGDSTAAFIQSLPYGTYSLVIEMDNWGTPAWSKTLVLPNIVLSAANPDTQLNIYPDGISVEAAAGGLIREFSLSQNFPNPLTSASRIDFAVPHRVGRAAPVLVIVYDVRGAAVRTLVNGWMTPGRHTAAWDGFDGRGKALATGVYFYRLRAGNFVQTRKMMIVR